MKQDPKWAKIQKNMRPGVISIRGFLGGDKRDLIQILDEDHARVEQLHVMHQQIAAKMTAFRDAGMQGLGEFIDVEPHFSVRVDSVRGKLCCPFEDPCLSPKTNVTVRNLAIDQEITYTDLNIHLIAEHGFYQGKGSPFRLEPEELVKILEIQ